MEYEMEHVCEEMISASKVSECDDGKVLFETLKAHGYHVWEVGPQYYLWVDNEPIDIRKHEEMKNKCHRRNDWIPAGYCYYCAGYRQNAEYQKKQKC